MTNKIVAIQGNHPSKLNPKTDTSIFLANEIQKKKYRIFYYDPKDLSIVDSKVIAKGFFIRFNYNNNLRNPIGKLYAKICLQFANPCPIVPTIIVMDSG